MASAHRSTSTGPGRERTYFEQQREALLGDIGVSFEQVLANINKLNRSLESIIAVGNEFASVETLWSQFENVMGKEEEDGKQGDSQTQQAEEQQQQGSTRGVKREAESDEDEAMHG